MRITEIHPEKYIFKSKRKRINPALFGIYNLIYGSDFSQSLECDIETIYPYLFDSCAGQEYQLYKIHTGETSSSSEQYLLSQTIYSYDQSSSSESQYISSQIFSHDSGSGTQFHDYEIKVRTSDFAYVFEASFTTNVTPFIQLPCVLILSGPSPPDTINGAVTGIVGVPIGPFTVQPTEPLEGIVYLNDSSTLLPNATTIFLLSTGLFEPPFLTFTGSSVAQQFYYTPGSMGLRPISISCPQATVSAPVFIFANPA